MPSAAEGAKKKFYEASCKREQGISLLNAMPSAAEGAKNTKYFKKEIVPEYKSKVSKYEILDSKD